MNGLSAQRPVAPRARRSSMALAGSCPRTPPPRRWRASMWKSTARATAPSACPRTGTRSANGWKPSPERAGPPSRCRGQRMRRAGTRARTGRRRPARPEAVRGTGRAQWPRSSSSKALAPEGASAGVRAGLGRWPRTRTDTPPKVGRPLQPRRTQPGSTMGTPADTAMRRETGTAAAWPRRFRRARRRGRSAKSPHERRQAPGWICRRPGRPPVGQALPRSRRLQGRRRAESRLPPALELREAIASSPFPARHRWAGPRSASFAARVGD